MKNLIFLLIVSLLFLAGGTNFLAQTCGQGTNQISLYVRNGQNAVNPKYHLYPASPTRHIGVKGMMEKLDLVAEYLSTTFFPTREVYFSRWWIRPELVKAEQAEAFIRGYDPKLFEQPFIDKQMDKGFSLDGKIAGSSLSFHSYETDDMPFLLKIWADNYEPVYVLEAHRGGCSRNTDVLLTTLVRPR